MSFLRELLNPVSSGPPSPAAARPSTPPPIHHHQLPYRSVEAVAPSNAQEAADTLTYFAKGGSNSPSNTHHHHHHHHHHNHHDHNNHQHDDDPGQASSSDTGGSSSPLPPVSPRRVQHPLPGNAVRAKSPLGGGVTEYIHPPTSSSPASSPSAASSSPPSASPGAGSSERDAEGDEEDDFEMGNTGSSRHGRKAAAAAAPTTVVSTTAAATALPSSSPPVVRSLSPTVVATPAPLMATQVLKPAMIATAAAAAKPTKKRPAAGTVTAKKRTNAEKKGTTTTTTTATTATTATTGTTSATTTAKPQKKKRKIVQDPTSDVEDEILVATRPATTTTTTKHTNKKHKDSNGSAHNHKHHAVAVAKTRAPSPVVPRALTPLPKFNDQGLELYCVCRKPDSGKWMIGCDGCEDWFHGECIKVAEEDGDLIDKYYCPRCVLANHGITTWKRKCRLPTCRRPARTNLKPKPSKYCSPEHGVAFFALNTTRSTLPLPELSTLSTSVSTAREFHLLGDRMPTPPLSDEAMRDYPEELMRLKELEAERKSLDCKKGRLEMRLKYIHFANARAKRIHEEMKTSDSTTTTTTTAAATTTKTAASSKIGKEICGYDFRLGLDDLDWEEWCASPEGKDVFENGRIPGREEVCVKKKCAKHGTWLSMRFEEVALEERLCVERLGQVRSEEKKIKERQKRRGVRDSREGTVEVESVG